MTQTQKSNLVEVEVFAQSVKEKLGDAIKLYPLAYVENINGQVGSVSVPKYTYIGDADVIAEGVAIDPALLSQTNENIAIVKVGKAVNMTKEAMKSGLGDPIGKAEEMLIKSISGGIEKKMFEALATATLAHTTAAAAGVTGDEVLAALQLFGEDVDGDKVILVNPNQYAKILKDAAYVKETNSIYGCEVVFSNRVPVAGAYIVKAGAVGLYLSDDLEVESDKDILAKATVISADQFFATHLRDASLAVKITLA